MEQLTPDDVTSASMALLEAKEEMCRAYERRILSASFPSRLFPPMREMSSRHTALTQSRAACSCAFRVPGESDSGQPPRQTAKIRYSRPISEVLPSRSR